MLQAKIRVIALAAVASSAWCPAWLVCYNLTNRDPFIVGFIIVTSFVTISLSALLSSYLLVVSESVSLRYLAWLLLLLDVTALVFLLLPW